MYSNLEDACAAKVSRQQVINEIKDHHLDPNDFFSDEGDKPEYMGYEVLAWLGY